ncbi:MAG: ATP-binding protein [Anaeromyxobacteraceae bacterium]
MTHRRRDIARAMTLTAAAIAASLVVGLPAVFFANGYQYTLGALDTEAEVSAREAGRLVFANPTMWTYEQVRLSELLERRSSAAIPETRRILDRKGHVVAERAVPLGRPIVSRRHPIADATGLIAEVQVTRSLRPLLVETCVALACAALAAALGFAVLRAVPLRALKHAQHSLVESERRYRSLYETLTDGMALHRIVRDGAGHAVSFAVVDANPAFARMLELDAARVPGLDATALLGGALVPFVPRMIEAAAAGESCAFEVSTPDARRTFQVSVSSPTAGHLGTLLEDVTERRHLQEQLTHSQRIQAVGRLAGGVAHDFNNILTVILSYAGTLAAELEGEHRGDAQEIQKAAYRAASLTRQLLAFSRKQILRPEVLQLDVVVGDLAKMIGRLIGEDITLSVDLEAGVGSIHMDPAQLEQVLVNLAVNARDAMPDGGRLMIAARNAAAPRSEGPERPAARRDDVVLTVSDTGTGMDEQTRSRLFEPFFTTKAKGKGTGLGLAMVFGAVHQSGGAIEVASEIGKGTTFTIRLPRVDALAQPPPRTAPPVAPRRAARILLVDDERQVRAAVRLLLTSGGYSVVEAASGDEGIAAFHADRPGIDLVLTDLVMPGMGGLALGRAVCACRPVPVLYMSGYSEEVVSGRETISSEAFLQKPFDRAVLLDRVGAALDRAGAAAAPHAPSSAGAG